MSIDNNSFPKITDEEIQCYINNTMTETFIQDCENNLLNVLKFRREKYPSDKNDAEWLEYSNLICKRRYKN